MNEALTDRSSRARTVIIEDDPAFQLFMEACISRHEGAELIGSFGCLQTLLRELHITPDMLLLDLSLPDVNGLDAIPLLRARFPQAKVVVISASQGREAVVGAFREGASGYIVKNGNPVDVSDNLQRVLAGDTVVSRQALDTLLCAIRSEAAGLDNLTGRERETLLLLRSGQSYKQTAHTMGVSINTVRTHVRTLYRKLGVRSIIEAAKKLRGSEASKLRDD